jgi:PKD repeat protein
VNRFTRDFLWAALLLAFAASTFAQGWALPAKTPETPVSCAGCPNVSDGTKTVGYKLPLSTFTGRFLDSSNTSEWFLPFRTARADEVLVMPGLNRIYFRIGNGSIGAYSLSGFFSRLEAGEPLVFAFGSVSGDRGGHPELFLRWDEWLNPEAGGGWRTFNVDGAERLSGFDVDDQGYVYVAATIWGWGICKDGMTTAGSTMSLQYQSYPPKDTTSMITARVVALKGSGSRYYAIVSNTSQSQMWDVTNRAKPTRISTTVPTIRNFAKTSTGDRVAIIDTQGKLSIGGGDDFAAGNPVFADTGYSLITSDGTNFYGLQYKGGGNVITVLVPSGTSYVVQGSYPTGAGMDVTKIHYGDGFLVLSGIDAGSGWDFRVLKVSNFQPTPLTINASPANSSYPSYFRNYYGTAPTGYAAPGNVNSVDGVTYKSPTSGKTYLIICAKGIGDVYELQGGDSITVTNDGPKGTPNLNAPTANNGKTYYGDPIEFTAKTSSTTLSTVVWNFGNTEAGPGKNSLQTSAISRPIPYQYSNLTKTSLGSKTVTASSISDSSIRGTTTATLEMPTARFGIAGNTKLLFTQPNASSPAPIVVGDSFVDASDGSVESHYASWAFDGTVTKALPNDQLPVGSCGTHSLTFTTFYGPYSGAGAGLATLLQSAISNFVVGLDANNGAVTYAVRPFAAAIELAGSDASNITFRSASRTTTDTRIMTTAQQIGLTWMWEVINSAGVSVNAPSTGQGTTVQPFVVSKATLNAGTVRVRLTLQTNAPFVTGGCNGYETSVAVSAPLIPPDPQITQTGTCQGAACTFTASSISGIDMTADAWSFKWDVLKSGIVDTTSYTLTGDSTSKTFTPLFTKVGDYDIRLTVQNAITSTNKTVRVTVTTAGSICAPLTAASFKIAFSGAACSSSNSTPCTAGENVTFVASNLSGAGSYDDSCAPHTYTWTFPGNVVVSGIGGDFKLVRQAITTSGDVSLRVQNSVGGDVTYHATVTVGSSLPPPTGNPCGTMGSQNIFITYIGATSGCSSSNTGTPCKNGESLTFNVSPIGYNFGCADHNFSWNFGDGGGTASTQLTTHAYSASGPHTVSVTISNNYQSPFQKQLTLSTSDSGGGTGGQCAQMTTSNIAIAYSAPSGCTSNNTAVPCKNSESVSFDVTSFAGYDFSCTNQWTYSWNFGDSGTATVKSPSHTFTTSGSHTVSMTITNPAQPSGFTRQLTMQTNSGTGGTCGIIVPNISLSIDYHNPTNTCGPLGGSCGNGEAISFTVKDFGAYDSSCATHTYDWNFGDNSPHGSGRDVVHQYAAGGTYTVQCIVNNTSHTVTLTQPVSVGGNPGGVEPIIEVPVTPLLGVPHGFTFAPSVTGAPATAVYEWDFGDGTIQTRNNTDAFIYVYARAGKYTVTLKVFSNSSKAQLLKTQTMTVSDGTKRRSVRH